MKINKHSTMKFLIDAYIENYEDDLKSVNHYLDTLETTHPSYAKYQTEKYMLERFIRVLNIIKYEKE